MSGEVTGSEVFTGLVAVFLAAEVDTSGPFGEGFVQWANDTRDKPRVCAMLPRSDARAEGSGNATWREMQCEWQAIYPRTVEGMAQMLDDAVVVERAVKDIPARMLAIDTPVGSAGSLKNARLVGGPDFDFGAFPAGDKVVLKILFAQQYLVGLETT